MVPARVRNVSVRAGVVVPVHATAIALSACLLFVVQPIVGRLVLPLLGGAASVWTTCLVFFQAALLGGYPWAHLQARLSPALQCSTHNTRLSAAGTGVGPAVVRFWPRAPPASSPA